MLRTAEVRRIARLLALCGFSALALPSAGGQVKRDSVATSMTGSVRAIERPTAVSQLIIAPNNSAIPVENLSQLLSGRFAGVQVLSGGATGTGSRIRIRGQSSILLGNEPLIVVDGVRLLQTLNAAAQLPSRADDINVDDIERVEIINGPSGTSTYGSRAAHGVINITTKRGVAGKLRVNAYTEHGLVNDPNTYPDLWLRWGKRVGSTVSVPCVSIPASQGACATDSVPHGNIMNIDSLTPVDVGYRSQYGLQVSGGAERLQFFVAAEREDETGVFKMPARDERRLEAASSSAIPKSQLRPSALERNSFRANVSTQLGSMLNVDWSGAYIGGDTRLPPASATSEGLFTGTLAGQWDLNNQNAKGVPLVGYFAYPAGELMSQVTKHENTRYFGGVSVEFKPVEWLSFRTAYGLDHNVQDLTIRLAGNSGLFEIPFNGTYLRRAYVKSTQKTLDASGTFAFQPLSWMETRTTVGFQQIENRDSSERFVGNELAGSPGVPSGIGSSAGFHSKGRTTGVFVTQSLSLYNQLFISAGLRRDAATVHTFKQHTTNFPSAGVAWLLSEQEAFRNQSAVTSLRLRAAYGETGQFPMPSDGVTLSTDIPAFGQPFPASPGASLTENKPEISREWASGIDASLFGEATHVNVTYFHKRTRNVYMPRIAPPILGGVLYYVAANAATVQNSGIELAFRQRLVDRRSISASVGIVGATNRNRMTALRADVPPLFSGNRTMQQSRLGYPLFGLWGRSYTYSDVNGDHIITSNELTLSDTAVYVASSIPTRMLTLSPRVELFNHKLRIGAQIDSKWGFRKMNNTLRHQCQQARSCRAANDLSAPLEQQAAAVAAPNSLAGFYEDASFTRFREASVELELPSRVVRAVRANTWSVTLTGRNLGVATNYSGIDPESVVGVNDVDGDEYFSTPPMRYFTLRFNVRW